MFGTIHRLKFDRGFGFVRPEGETAQISDHFFHYRDLVDLVFSESLINQRVEFDSEYGPKGLAARRVRPVN
jgi:cold shock CspA family protein